jgi:hypothetical protein
MKNVVNNPNATPTTAGSASIERQNSEQLSFTERVLAFVDLKLSAKEEREPWRDRKAG